MQSGYVNVESLTRVSAVNDWSERSYIVECHSGPPYNAHLKVIHMTCS